MFGATQKRPQWWDRIAQCLFIDMDKGIRMDSEIPLFEISWDINDIHGVIESVGRGGYWAKGPFVTQFESALENYLDVEHAITVNSGTTALVAALEALGIEDGDEVIIPSFTFIATANAVKLVGAEPIFADIESTTYGLDPEGVGNRITEDTAAILPVHPYGTSCRIEELREIATAHNTFLVEDAAEVLGAEYRGHKLGSFGDVAALSFCQNKIIATGEGGAVVTDDDEIAERVRLYRSHGRASENYFESSGSGQYVGIGTNIRMSDLTAALGCSQLEKIGSLIEGRRQAANRLIAGLDPIDGVEPHGSLSEATHVYQLFTVELAESIDRQEVIDSLDKRNIASKVYWDPAVHQTEYYRTLKDQNIELPVTEKIAENVLSLPMHPGLTPHETDRIVAGVKEALE